MAYRLAELAELVGGRVEGDPERAVESIQTLEAAGPRDLAVLKDPRWADRAARSGAGVLLVGPQAAGQLGGRGDGDRRPEGARPGGDAARDLLVVADPAAAFARLLVHFHARPEREPGIHPTAIVEAGAVVDPSAFVGPYAVIGAGSRIGAGAAVHALAVVGRDCAVGDGAVLHPHVVLYDRTEVGPACEVHAGAILGSDGFGYLSGGATERGAAHRKVPQVGRVALEAEVEVGANSTIDRATLGETRIGAGTKIDNLVQVGHNVQVGKGCILCGQAGIAGSARLGDGVVLAGQAGVAGHLTVGAGARVAAKSAALSTVEPGQDVAGIPAVPLRRWRRQVVLASRLEEMSRRLRELSRRLEAPERGRGEEG